MATIVLLTAALDYPGSTAFEDADAVGQLAAWLEDMKIRLYPEGTRAALRGETGVLAQRAAVGKYLEDLGGPASHWAGGAGAAVSGPALAEWLLGQAIGFEYNERADDLNAASAALDAAEADAAPRERAADAPIVFSDIDTPAARAALEDLADALGIAGTAAMPTAALLAAVAVPVWRLGPALLDYAGAAAAAAAAGEPPPPVPGPADFPAGFDMGGGPALALACTALRARFASDLRDVQSQVDDLLGECQQLAPATRLGKW